MPSPKASRESLSQGEIDLARLLVLAGKGKWFVLSFVLLGWTTLLGIHWFTAKMPLYRHSALPMLQQEIPVKVGLANEFLNRYNFLTRFHDHLNQYPEFRHAAARYEITEADFVANRLVGRQGIQAIVSAAEYKGGLTQFVLQLPISLSLNQFISFEEFLNQQIQEFNQELGQRRLAQQESRQVYGSQLVDLKRDALLATYTEFANSKHDVNHMLVDHQLPISGFHDASPHIAILGNLTLLQQLSGKLSQAQAAVRFEELEELRQQNIILGFGYERETIIFSDFPEVKFDATSFVRESTIPLYWQRKWLHNLFAGSLSLALLGFTLYYLRLKLRQSMEERGGVPETLGQPPLVSFEK